MNKKNILAFISCFLILFIFSSCGFYNNTNPSETTEKNEGTIEEFKTTAVLNEITPETDAGGASISTRKYRVNYYDVPYQFVLLVGEDAFWEWDETRDNEDPDETNVMVMKTFIEYFNITREEFDKANLEWTKTILYDMGGKPVMNPKDFANQETDESYNADIIYTFDDEVINNYYLSGYYPYIFESDYEKAVESGEYVSQTTDWIDIEQMEAEIIAKYGEAEIVTEAAETTTEE